MILAEESKSKLIQQINKCNNFLETLTANVSHTAPSLKWFQELCENLKNAILMIVSLPKTTLEMFETHNTLLLYLNQLVTCLTLFINIFVSESEIRDIIFEARNFAKKQANWCLEGFLDFFNTPQNNDVGSFIKWMDSALEKMSEIDYEKQKQASIVSCDEAKILCEEVLSHAMSIAQVALEDDYKIIRGSSQSVLEALDTLTKEINKSNPNISMLSVFIDTCTNKLCSLERRVNTAVLKLSLKVFADYTNTLEAVHMYCCNENNQGKSEELDSLVVEFDLHVDRIMQIGLFAVSCSTCIKSCTKIRSCLASMEALETELVPAFNAVLLDKSNHNLQLALILKNHWLKEAKHLQKLIFLIIDPFAFCQVTYEENKQLIEYISDEIKSKVPYLQKKHIDKLVDHSNVLEKFMIVVLNEQKESNMERIRTAFGDFRNVLHEVKAACDNLLIKGTISHDNNFRIYKRCQILLTCTKALWYTFIDDNEKEAIHEEPFVKNDAVVTNNPFLDHIINRGRDILKERSILNPVSKLETHNIRATTLRKMAEMKGAKKSLPLSKLVHLRKISFMNSTSLNQESCNLQMTDCVE